MTEYSVHSNSNFLSPDEALSASERESINAQQAERGTVYKLVKNGIVVLIFVLIGVLLVTFLSRDEASVTERNMDQWKLTALFLIEIGLAVCGYLRLARWLRS